HVGVAGADVEGTIGTGAIRRVERRAADHKGDAARRQSRARAPASDVAAIAAAERDILADRVDSGAQNVATRREVIAVNVMLRGSAHLQAAATTGIHVAGHLEDIAA